VGETSFVLLVDRAELEAEVRIVLLARYAHDTRRCLAVERLCSDDGVFVELLLQQGSYPRDDAYAHLGVDGGERMEDGEDNTKEHAPTVTSNPAIRSVQC
jgi:hypothetical protein